MDVIPITAVPGWPQPAAGALDGLMTTGVVCEVAPDGLHVSSGSAATSYLNAYVGSADQLKFNKNTWLSNLETLYESKYAAGFNYTGPDGVKRTFQIDPTSQFNIDVIGNAALGSTVNGETWDTNTYFIAADNSHMALATAASARSFALAAKAYVSGMILHNRSLKDQINAATSMSALSAIDITAGWPPNS